VCGFCLSFKKVMVDILNDTCCVKCIGYDKLCTKDDINANNVSN